MNASDFKAKCLSIIDEVGATGETVVIEKRGKPVAQLICYTPTEAEIPQESLRGSVRITGDIIAPVIGPEEWNAIGENG